MRSSLPMHPLTVRYDRCSQLCSFSSYHARLLVHLRCTLRPSPNHDLPLTLLHKPHVIINPLCLCTSLQIHSYRRIFSVSPLNAPIQQPPRHTPSLPLRPRQQQRQIPMTLISQHLLPHRIVPLMPPTPRISIDMFKQLIDLLVRPAKRLAPAVQRERVAAEGADNGRPRAGPARGADDSVSRDMYCFDPGDARG
jgi:hypothetical protein